jgi:hypothetical protein
MLAKPRIPWPVTPPRLATMPSGIPMITESNSENPASSRWRVSSAQACAERIHPRVRGTFAVFKIQVCGDRIIFRALCLHIQVNHAFFVQRSSSRRNAPIASGGMDDRNKKTASYFGKNEDRLREPPDRFLQFCIGRVSVLYVN